MVIIYNAIDLLYNFHMENVLKNIFKKEKPLIIVCPDSFKGTMSAVTVARIISDAILSVYPFAEVKAFPVADGGEGTIDCISSACDCVIKSAIVNDAYFNKTKARYALLGSGEAVIETAEVAGLYKLKELNPLKTSTFGLGEILSIVANENRKILFALGGSSTNDGGAGIAAACGAKFFNKDGKEFIPTGGTLLDIESIDVSNLIKAEIECMCDVENPLYGENGAAYVFAPQKGADEEMVRLLDAGLRHYAKKIKEFLGVDVSDIKGGGAAGGMAAGLFAFFGAKIKSGIDLILDTLNFDDIVKRADLVITGEGKLDLTSFSGKVIGGIIKRAKKLSVPVAAICGTMDKKLAQSPEILSSGGLICAAYVSDGSRPFDEIIKTCKEDLFKTAADFISSFN